MIIFKLLAIYSLSFLIKEMDGPFSCIAKIRNLLLMNRIMGTFFYSLLNCYYCVGAYSGIIIYFLTTPLLEFSIRSLILWMLVGAITSFMMSIFLEYLSIKITEETESK